MGEVTNSGSGRIITLDAIFRVDCLNSEDTVEVGSISRLNTRIGFGARILYRNRNVKTRGVSELQKRSARSFERSCSIDVLGGKFAGLASTPLNLELGIS